MNTDNREDNTMLEIVRDRLYKKRETAELEGIGLTALHHRVCRGEYEVVEDGTRNPKITGRSILRRRELHLRPAKYGLRAGKRGIPSKAEPASSAGERPRGRPPKHAPSHRHAARGA